MKNKRVLSFAIASALGLLAPVTVNAFGLGKIEINSALNEPFNAQIPVTALKPGEAQDLQVRLASNEEFEKAGLERSFILTDFTFEIVKKSATDVVIKVSSKKSVREPLLDFLLTTTSGNGRLIREYTVLLDPPTHVLAKPETQQAGSTLLSENEVKSEPSIESVKPSAELVSAQYKSNEYGVTTSSDTLWKIAKKVRPSTDVSMNQMMIALLNENPKAFKNQNINGLKTGYSLRIPTVDNINEISKQQASQAVVAQNTEWNNRNRSDRAPIREESSAPTSDLSTNLNEGQINTGNNQTTSTVIGTTEESDSKLSLVTPSQGEQVIDDVTSEIGDEKLENLSEQLTFAQETIEAQAQQSIEIESRMAAMEEQLETMRRLISLKDADLARLQSLLEEEQQNDPELEEELKTVVENTVEGTQELIDELESVVDDIAQSEMPDEVLSAETKTVVDSDAEIIANETSTENTVDNIEPQSPTEQAVNVDMIVETIANVTGAEPAVAKDTVIKVTEFVKKNKVPMSLACILLLVILLLLFRRKKSEDNEEEAAPQIVVQAAEPAGIEEDENSDNDDSESELNASDEVVAVKTASDLIAQADVFVGYADYAQARTSLEQARFIEPDNTQAVSKLLFVLYKQQQTEKFIQLIEDAAVNETYSDWQQIESWGKELAPEYELFVDAPIADDNYAMESESLVPEDEGDTEIELDSEISDTALEEQEEKQDVEDESYLEFDATDYQVENNDQNSIETESLTADEVSQAENDIDFTNDSAESDEDSPLTIDNENVPQELNREADFSLDIEQSSDAHDDDVRLSIDEDVSNQSDSEDAELSLDIDDSSENHHAESADLRLDDDLSFEIDQLDEQPSASLDTSLESTTDSSIDLESDELSIGTGDLEFDLDNFDEIDEAETKLDLAVAYIDMGDPDGARSILDEVISDGTNEQKSRAQDLLDTLS